MPGGDHQRLGEEAARVAARQGILAQQRNEHHQDDQRRVDQDRRGEGRVDDPHARSRARHCSGRDTSHGPLTTRGGCFRIY
jgi:hypothetical protein